MYFYEVIPASSKFLGYDPLTYSCNKNLKNGQVVEIKFRRFSCLGFIVSKVGKPEFTTHKITHAFSGLALPVASLNLFDWMVEYYPGPLGPTAQLFLPSYLPKKTAVESSELSGTRTSQISLPQLTKEQENAISKMGAVEYGAFLLHGITGSGKTRVYLELAKKCVQQNKSVIILTPEISLTPQLVEFFEKTFGEKILLTHSGLTPSQRAKVWLKCLSGKEPWIVMGPRSALFSPLSDLGMVVVDESHDSSYKQDRLPFYNALRVAGYLCSNTKSKLIMGSATPAVNEYFLAKAKDIPILTLNKKAIEEKSTTEIEIVDITDKGERSNYPLLGKTLIKNISEAIENNIQSMVFINKRGDSKSIVCQNCGWRAKCSRCDLPLTYHSDESVFSCHTCGNDYPARTSCQLCGSPDIIFKSPGTKAIAKSLSKIFPHAIVARFDTDNKKAERIDSRHKEIVSGDIDILVGTQLITKGHDLPRLGIAAMLVAESDLNFPDFTAEEKTFQSIRQLSGRVGRGHLPGKVIVQSFNPKNHLIKQATDGSYSEFYESQIKEREEYGFPPFYYALKILLPRASSKSSLAAAEKLSGEIKKTCPKCIILGPSTSFYFKKSGKYYWQLIVKAKNRSDLTEVVKQLPSNCVANIDPLNLL